MSQNLLAKANIRQKCRVFCFRSSKMSQDLTQEKEKYDFDELDQAVRRWIVMNQWEKDLENYENLKNEYEQNIQLGYN
jgi:hypothetical protein